jgi:CheY-like chemotaxis protein
MNLVTNAFLAMQEKGGVLQVSLAPVELDRAAAERIALKPGPYVLLEVSDTGKGISPDIIDRIFEPYFTTGKKGESTGLGLSVVHGIVKSHKGHVAVSSTLGQGTTFQVYLPLHVKGAAVSGGDEEMRAIPRGNERILLVDDEETIIDLFGKVLEGLGYKVTAESESLAALQRFQKQPDAFDLVITDMNMPHMHGDELSRQLLAIRPDLPIILCTGYHTMISEKQAKTIGIRKFALKPILRKELASLIRQALDGK